MVQTQNYLPSSVLGSCQDLHGPDSRDYRGPVRETDARQRLGPRPYGPTQDLRGHRRGVHAPGGLSPRHQEIHTGRQQNKGRFACLSRCMVCFPISCAKQQNWANGQRYMSDFHDFILISNYDAHFQSLRLVTSFQLYVLFKEDWIAVKKFKLQFYVQNTLLIEKKIGNYSETLI